MDCTRRHFDVTYLCPLCQQVLRKTGGVCSYSKTGKMSVQANPDLHGCQKLHCDDHLKCACGYETEVELAWLADRYKRLCATK